jgi:hypothetical protein
MTVYALDEYETPRIKWNYTYAFPTNLGEIQFSERDTKQIECNFTFQFSQLLCELYIELINIVFFSKKLLAFL